MCVQTGDLVICRLRRHSKSLPYMRVSSSQSITMINHTTILSNQVIGIPNHTLDQITNMSNQISKESDQIGEYSLSIQNQNIDMPDQIGEYWLDFLMTNSGEITINGIHKT